LLGTNALAYFDRASNDKGTFDDIGNRSQRELDQKFYQEVSSKFTLQSFTAPGSHFCPGLIFANKAKSDLIWYFIG
jgi:hypothetical protein